jgi:hypothetical protein
MFEQIYGYIRDRTETGTYQIKRESFDEITMKAQAIDPEGNTVTVKGTYAFAPELTWYDEDSKEWIRSWEWIYQH